MADRKAELERKKERLRQMREEKERRRKEKEKQVGITLPFPGIIDPYENYYFLITSFRQHSC
jgi:hypothetical protein